MRSARNNSDYLNAIAREPLLTAQEEIELARLVQAGIAPDATELERRRGIRARNRMVAANMRLAVAEANRQVRVCQSMEFRDLVQEAAIGLARAAEKFDPSRGYKFSTYAYWWVRQAIRRSAAMEDAMIRIPVHIRDGSYRAGRIADEARRDGRELTFEETAERVKVNPVTWRAAQAVAMVSSLNRLCGDEETSEVIDTIAAPDAMPAHEREQEDELRDKVRAMLDDLPHGDGELLRRFHGIGREAQTLTQIGRDKGVSRESIRQKYDRGRRRLARDLIHLKAEGWV